MVASGKEPTGEWDCTYTYEKVGELSIDELEGWESGRIGPEFYFVGF